MSRLGETKAPMFLVQHRLVRLQNLLACVSDVRRYSVINDLSKVDEI